MVGFIERHRKIVGAVCKRPVAYRLVARKIGDLDLLLIRNIDENAGSGLLKLEGLGMGIRGNLRNLLSRHVQDRHCPVSLLARRLAIEGLFSSVADDHMLAAGVIADIVDIRSELHRLQKPQRAAVKNLDRAVAARSDEKMLGGRIVIGSLRLIQIGNRGHLPAGLQIDHLKRVIVERRREKALARQIYAQMIHPPVDIGQGDAGRQLQGRGCLAKSEAR